MHNINYLLMIKLLIFAALILLTACQSKETYLADFARFVEDVKAEGDNYSLEQWQNAEKSFQQFAEVDYQKHLLELTKAEREQVGRLKASYHVVLAKRDLKNFMNDAKDSLYELKGVVEEITDSVE